MKYALFVLGMILIVVGGYFLISGSNIIEVERGWSAVISGTTALTGGVITLGLAGIVKALEDMQRPWAAADRPGLAAARVETPVPGGLARETPIPDLGAATLGVEATSLFEDEIVRSEAPLPPAPEVIPNPLPSASPKEPPRREHPRLTPQFERAPEKAEPSAAVAALRQRVADDFSLNWPSFSQHEEPTAPDEPGHAEVTPPPLHFDRFDIDEPALPLHEAEPETDQDIEPEAEAAAAPEPVETESAEADSEPVFEPESPKPKAIGRYEAEGTVYVMFADGSIEAQSAEGTRHFQSMAELKASFHA